MSLVRELDGIAHQIVDDLRNSQRIALDPCGQLLVPVGAQAQAFALGCARLHAHDFIDQLFEIEIDGLNLQLPRLDFGKIQDVIQDAQQRHGRRVRVANIGFGGI